MRYRILIGVLGLALALDLALLVATGDDALESFDPLRPATLLPIVEHGLHELAAAAGDFVRDLVAWFAALHHSLPAASGPQ